MRRIKWEISTAALLVFALLYFFDGSGIVSAAVPAIVVHELGHLLALRVCGKRISKINLGLFGLKIDYIGELTGLSAVFCSGSGPLFGLFYAGFSTVYGSEFLQVSGSISLALSMFNLLPVLPLDGGRMFSAVFGEQVGKITSKTLSAAFLAGGILLLIWCGYIGMSVISLWLFLHNFRR